jgi:restriction system protein
MPEKIIWGIHAGKTGEAESLFLQKKVIALGWVEFGTLEGLKTREAFKQKYTQVYPDASVQSVATSAGQLYRFVYEVKVGDFVVFPSKGDRHVHIGEITGEYMYRPDIDKHYSNQRTVKWLTQVPRTRFSQGSLYEMGSAMSLFQIRNYADEITAVLEGAPAPVAPKDETVSLVAEDIENQTRDFVLKQLERNMKGLPLEDFIQHLLEKMGYRARLARTNEPSVDLIAHKDELGFEPPIIKVQVKSSPTKITDHDVSALYGKVSQQEFGLLITLGEFTGTAWQFAMSKSNLRLIDGIELVDLILEHYDEFDPRYKGIIPLKKIYIPQALDTSES